MTGPGEAARGRMELYMSQKLTQMTDTRRDELTGGELAALEYVAMGFNASEAARELAIGEEQVEALMRSAQGKLGAANRVNAVAIAIRLGLIGIEA